MCSVPVTQGVPWAVWTLSLDPIPPLQRRGRVGGQPGRTELHALAEGSTAWTLSREDVLGVYRTDPVLLTLRSVHGSFKTTEALLPSWLRSESHRYVPPAPNCKPVLLLGPQVVLLGMEGWGRAGFWLGSEGLRWEHEVRDLCREVEPGWVRAWEEGGWLWSLPSQRQAIPSPLVSWGKFKHSVLTLIPLLKASRI